MNLTPHERALAAELGRRQEREMSPMQAAKLAHVRERQEWEAEVKKLRADKRRLDWLEKEYDSTRGISALGLWLLEKACGRKHLQPLRAAIDGAMDTHCPSPDAEGRVSAEEKRPAFRKVGCEGYGYFDCFCGGDFCVCRHQGEIPCYGCDDCESADDDFDEEDDQP